MSGGSFFIAVSPQYLMDLRPQMHLPTFFHQVAADARPHCTGFPDAGSEKGSGAEQAPAAANGETPGNPRTSQLAAVVSDTPRTCISQLRGRAGGRKVGGRGVENQGPTTTSPHRLLHYYPTPSSLRHQSTLDHCIVITMSFIGELLFLLLDGGCYVAMF